MFKMILKAGIIILMLVAFVLLMQLIPTPVWEFVWLICLAFLGASSAVALALIILMIVLPIYAGLGIFVSGPQGLNKSGFHLFTSISPGEIKIIERAKKPVRMIASLSARHFAKNKSPNDPEHWELVSGESEDPIADIWFPLRWWARIIYQNTGLVFTGVWPFQKVREYELERTTVVRVEGNPNSESNLKLEVKRDISDHFRARQFLFPVRIAAAETKDKMPVDVIGVAELEVTNPHKAAYGSDRWDRSIINLITDAITVQVKTMTLDQALTANDSTEARMISTVVMRITDDQIVCGIQIHEFRILEINPRLDQEGLNAIRAEAVAIQKGKATRIDGEARAYALNVINKANKEGGAAAVETMRAEALVRAAEAVGKNGGSAILMPPGNVRGDVDPTQLAILEELKKLNRS